MSAALQSQSLSVQQVRVQQQQLLLLLLLQQVLLLLQLRLQLLKQLKHPSLMATGVIGVLGDLALRLVVEELKQKQELVQTQLHKMVGRNVLVMRREHRLVTSIIAQVGLLWYLVLLWYLDLQHSCIIF